MILCPVPVWELSLKGYIAHSLDVLSRARFLVSRSLNCRYLLVWWLVTGQLHLQLFFDSMANSKSTIWLILTILAGSSVAHSWNEQLSVIINGAFKGPVGYPRGYVPRSYPGFTDNMMTYLLPPLTSGRTRVDDSDLLCAPHQRTKNQTEGYPQLRTSPGTYIAIKYLENGHVTLPENQPGKPNGMGDVYVFGTSEPDSEELLTEVLQWTSDGTGGDRRGRLLTVQSFDDGRCYQINDGDISTTRQLHFPNPVPGDPASVNEQWCETDLKIPKSVTGNSYTIYWVWKWPTSPGVPGLPDGKDEFYTTCSDLEIVSQVSIGDPTNLLPGQDPQIAAVNNFKERAEMIDM